MRIIRAFNSFFCQPTPYAPPDAPPKPYLPLSSDSVLTVLKEGNARVYDLSNGSFGNRAYSSFVTRGADTIDLAAEVLRREKIESIRYLGAGDNAVIAEVLPLSKQVIRFRGEKTDDPSTWQPPNVPQVLQPLFTHEVNGCRIEAYPKVIPLDIAMQEGKLTEEQAIILMHHLRAGLLKNDPPCYFRDHRNNHRIKFEQVGLLADNTPVIIDTGSALKLSDYVEDIEKWKRENPKDTEKCDRMLEETRKDITHLLNTPLPDLAEKIGWDGRWITSSGKNKIDILAQTVSGPATGRTP